MIKQAVLHKLATLRLAINYVLRNRGITKSANVQPTYNGSTTYAGQPVGRYPGSAYHTPRTTSFTNTSSTGSFSNYSTTGFMGPNRNQLIQDTVTKPTPASPWQWDDPSSQQAQPVAMGASKPLPRQPKPVQQPAARTLKPLPRQPKPVQRSVARTPKPEYTPLKMHYSNGQYYGKGHITTWGDQIATERANLEHNFNLAPNKEKWRAEYEARTQALAELENKWNQFNSLRQSTRLTYDRATNQYTGYTGDNSLIEKERNLLNMARDMYSPERLKKSIGAYNQKMKALNNIPGNTGLPYNPYDGTPGPYNVPTEDTPKRDPYSVLVDPWGPWNERQERLSADGFWGVPAGLSGQPYLNKDYYGYSFSTPDPSKWEGQLDAEQKRLEDMRTNLPMEAEAFMPAFNARVTGLNNLRQSLNDYNQKWKDFNFAAGLPVANPSSMEDWDQNEAFIKKEQQRLYDAGNMYAGSPGDLKGDREADSALERHYDARYQWQLDNGYDVPDWWAPEEMRPFKREIDNMIDVDDNYAGAYTKLQELKNKYPNNAWVNQYINKVKSWMIEAEKEKLNPFNSF